MPTEETTISANNNDTLILQSNMALISRFQFEIVADKIFSVYNSDFNMIFITILILWGVFEYIRLFMNNKLRFTLLFQLVSSLNCVKIIINILIFYICSYLKPNYQLNILTIVILAIDSFFILICKFSIELYFFYQHRKFPEFKKFYQKCSIISSIFSCFLTAMVIYTLYSIGIDNFIPGLFLIINIDFLIILFGLMFKNYYNFRQNYKRSLV